MCEQKKVISVDAEKQGVLINGMIHFRNDLLSQNNPVEIVNEVIDEIINAPTKKEKRRFDREAR